MIILLYVIMQKHNITCRIS